MESTLEAILNQADVISFHVPQNSETINYFNREFLESCKNPIYLLNVSRGKIVNLKNVVEGIQNGKIIGAGLDVLEYEDGSFENFFQKDLPEDFITLKNSRQVILSPHVAGWSTQSYFGLSKTLADKILARFS